MEVVHFWMFKMCVEVNGCSHPSFLSFLLSLPLSVKSRSIHKTVKLTKNITRELWFVISNCYWTWCCRVHVKSIRIWVGFYSPWLCICGLWRLQITNLDWWRNVLVVFLSTIETMTPNWPTVFWKSSAWKSLIRAVYSKLWNKLNRWNKQLRSLHYFGMVS